MISPTISSAIKVDQIGREMAPDGNYQLSITGHSLGKREDEK